ncbi:MAG: hypothetical protein MI923_24585 [Phycisphaerales bacterium]|nr:hypothetical protein [Phycisphaerales bacterium]
MKRFVTTSLLLMTLLLARSGHAAEIISQERSVTVHALALDGYFDDPVIVDDSASSLATGLFEEELDAIANGTASEVRARADQSSEINAGALAFEATGNAVASMYIQGLGEADADNTFRMTFEVGTDGKVTFTLINLIVDDRFGSDTAHDRPGDAEASVRILEDGTGTVVYEQSVVLDDLGTFEEILEEDPIDVNLAPGRYDLVIRAFATDDTDNDINEVTFGLAAASYDIRGTVSGGPAPPDTTPPAAPTNLTAVAGDGQVSLDWDDNTESDLQEYGIFRSTTSGGPYVEIDRDDPSQFVDPFAVNGVTYFYVVTASDTSNNESGFSNEVSATPQAPDTTPPAAPTNLTAVGGDGQVSLDWDDNTESDLQEYAIFRSTTSGGPYVEIDRDDPSQFVDPFVTNGVTYFYVVTALDTTGNESAFSNEVSATPQAPVPTTMHVDSIDLDTVGSYRKKGRATVRIVDNLGNPVANATVTGSFTGSFNETRSATTNSNGIAVLKTKKRRWYPSFTFCVDNVTHGTLTYEPGDNVETCDSF